jgi:hypothetical protein
MNLSIPSEKTPLFMKTEFRIQESEFWSRQCGLGGFLDKQLPFRILNELQFHC